MKSVIKWIVVFALLIGVITAAFSLYARFMLDYSLERMELALEVTEDKDLEDLSPVSRSVYHDVLNDLVVEEATKENVSHENLALLELASRSFDEALETGSYKRTAIYLKHVVNAKKAARGGMKRILDEIYAFYQVVLEQIKFFIDYSFKKITISEEDLDPSVSYASILLLNQAQQAVKDLEYEEAIGLYERYVKLYSHQGEVGLVKVNLADLYMRLNDIAKAESILKKVQMEFLGREESIVAGAKMEQVQRMKANLKMIEKVNLEIPKQEDLRQKSLLQLKLALLYIATFNFDAAEGILKDLEQVSGIDLQNKPQFYLGWLYKLKLNYEKSTEVFQALLAEIDLDEAIEFGSQTQLADIYYKTGDFEKSLRAYKAISFDLLEKQAIEDIERNIWVAVSELEQMKLYRFDYDDDEAARQLMRTFSERSLSYQFSVTEVDANTRELSAVAAELASSANVNLQIKAFDSLSRGRIHTAFDLFHRDLTKQYNDPWTHAGLATVYVLLGDIEEGLKLAKVAYDLRQDEYTSAVLAYAHALSQNYRDAIGLYENAIAKRPNYIPAMFNLSALYLKVQIMDRALELLDRVEGLLNEDQSLMRAKVANNKGYAYWVMGDLKKAMNYFQQALLLRSDFDVAQDNAMQLKTGSEPELVQLKELRA